MYLARWIHKGANINTSFLLEAGEDVKIDCAWFNETSQNIVNFYDPDGVQLGLQHLNELTTLCEFITDFSIGIQPDFSFQRKAIDLTKLTCSTGEECFVTKLVVPTI